MIFVLPIKLSKFLLFQKDKQVFLENFQRMNLSDQNLGGGDQPTTDGDEEIPPWILQLSFLVREETDSFMFLSSFCFFNLFLGDRDDRFLYVSFKQEIVLS